MSDNAAETKTGNLPVVIFELLLVGVGFAVAVLNWQSLLTDGSYYVGSEFVGPFLAVLGLTMLIAPEAPKTTDAEPAPAPSELYKLRQIASRTVLAVGLVATAVNFALFQGWLPPFWN